MYDGRMGSRRWLIRDNGHCLHLSQWLLVPLVWHGILSQSLCILSVFSLLYRSNLMGTKFTVYDSGQNPGKTTSSLEATNLRQELAAVCYVSPPVVYYPDTNRQTLSYSQAHS